MNYGVEPVSKLKAWWIRMFGEEMLEHNLEDMITYVSYKYRGKYYINCFKTKMEQEDEKKL